jgi:hypothetical protein
VRVGQRIDTGAVLGELEAGHPDCAAQACLHWGAMWGPASRADYVDPLGLVASTPIRLKPLRVSNPNPPRVTVFVRDTPPTSVQMRSLATAKPADGPDRAPHVAARP